MCKNAPLISVVMPAYNCQDVIAEAMHSVISQSFSEWELIVIDDGSNDNTLDVINVIASQDERIVSQPNKKNVGVSATRNKGIELARGEWIAFLDSDDIWMPLKLEKQLNVAGKKNSEFVFTGSSFIDREGKPYKGILEVPEEVTFKQLRKRNVISCSSVLIKKYLFDDIKMERDEIHEDFAAWLRILKLGVVAHGVNEPLLIYRLYFDSKSGNKLKGIKMSYNVYRFIGLNPISSAYYTFRNLTGAANKYRKILLKK